MGKLADAGGRFAFTAIAREAADEAALNFDYDEDQALLKAVAERFVADRYDGLRRREYLASATGFSATNWAILRDAGLLGLSVSEADGGYGGGPVELMAVAEAFGRGLVVEPFATDLLLGAGLLARSSDAGLKADWLPRVVGGTARLVLAHAEAAARFRSDHVRTCATPAGAGWHISGTKSFVLAPVGAAGFLVTARGSDGDIALFLVAADVPGLLITPYRLIDGSVAGELVFDDAPGVVVAGVRPDDIDAAFDDARHACCAEMVGAMSLLFEATLDYVKTRRQFGRAIGSFQAIQHRLTTLYGELELARSHLLRCTLTAPPGRARAIAEAKAYISSCALHMGEECVQLHGAMGTSDEMIVGHGYKRLLLLSSMFGDADAEIVRVVRIGRSAKTLAQAC